MAKDELRSGKLVAKGASWAALGADAPGTDAGFVEPDNALLKFMDESGLPDSRLKKSSGEWLSRQEFKAAATGLGSLTEYKNFRTWYDEHSAEWMRRRTGQAEIDALREYSFGRVIEFVDIANLLAANLRRVPDA